MAAQQDEILSLIQGTYVPFLKKLIAHLEKKKDIQPKSFDKLKYVYKTFNESDSKEKIEVYEACRDMLERWHKRYKDMRAHSDKKPTNDFNAGSEDSQSDTSLSSAKMESNKPMRTSFGQNMQNSEGKKSSSQRGTYFQDEIEIESSDSSSAILPTTSESKTEKWVPVLNIKKEKDPISTPATVTQSPSVQTVSAPITTTQSAPEPKEIVFVCASCQFRTTNEADFMKHARTDHRTDLSLWCKQCGKCFSNAGVLVSHIKENSCTKEEMIYRCGVKDCTFETPSGQTFVHHLRHCHKGSPFIFCIHCQKIFTLPHCLILHMQNECPFKEKNRRNPGAAPTPVSSQQVTVSSVATVTTPVPKPIITNLSSLSKTTTIPSVQTPVASAGSSARKGVGRSRGRGRGRGTRTKYSDSSDSDDPDDPSWRPEENLSNQPVRRSARWAKKVIDAKEPELDDSVGLVDKQKKAERPSKTFFHCPCCDFSALFKSLLEDHYVTDHKHPQKNSCSVCNVKFESKQYFVDHFAVHEKEKSEGKVVVTATSDEQPPADNTTSIPVEMVSQAQTMTPNPASSTMIIPYQTAIQEKLQKESKLKSFEDLKSTNDVEKMKTETKLQHFFKCIVYNCTFTTDDNVFYVSHLKEHHKGKRLHCAYCLEEYGDAQVLTDHMLKDHGKRCYQCSLCFYRGSSKPHVQIHIKNTHVGEKATVYQCSQHLPPGYIFKKENEEETDLTTTYPYVCAIGECEFKTYDPKEFKRHNDLAHRSVTVFFCHYCKVDFISFKRLMSHYHLHGINNFQCTYCVHGSDTKEEILVHLCNSHADKPFKVHVRTPVDCSPAPTKNDSSNEKGLFFATTDGTGTAKPSNDVSEKDKVIYKDSVYPMEIPCVGNDVFCKLGFCGELLDDMTAYVKHLVEEHHALNFLCPYCSFAADKISEFQNHLICHGPQLFACAEENCLYYSDKESDVGLHMINASHQSGSPKSIRKKAGCIAPKQLVDESVLRPMQTCSTSYVCPFCCYKCADQAMMKNHLYVELVYKRFQCQLCKIKAHSRREVKEHFKNAHSHHNIKCSIDSNVEVECFVNYFLALRVQQFTAKGLSIEKENWLKKSGLPAKDCANCSLSLPTIIELHHHMIACLSHDYQPYICNHCGAKTTDLIRMKCHTSTLHPGGSIKYAVFPNKLLEEQHGRKLQELRLNFLKELVYSVVDKSCVGEPKLTPKCYKCTYCKFVDNFRRNIEKHCLGCHKSKPIKVNKVKGDKSSISIADLSAQVETNSDSSHDSSEPMDTSTEEHFLCVYCTKKELTMADLDKHISSHHTLPDDGIYPYIYCPDPSRQFSPHDLELYECAYCSVTQENLYHLQRHCNNLHSAAAFHVRGRRAKNGSVFKCEYCECKMVSEELLAKHYQFSHPTKTHQLSASTKRKASDNGDLPNKRRQCVPEMYHCSYCKEKSDMILKITAHCEYAHPNLPVKYKTVKSDSSIDGVFSCDLCSFVGDKMLLSKHMSQKHENSVCCGHCRKYCESIAALHLHTVKEHSGQPEKLVDSANAFDTSTSVASGSTSGGKQGPVDLSNITVRMKCEDGSADAKLPVVYLAKLFPIFPDVVLHDYKKTGSKPT